MRPRTLAIPNEVVSAQGLAPVMSPTDEVVGVVVNEGVLSRLNRVPFLSISWSDHTKLREATQNVDRQARMR